MWIENKFVNTYTTSAPKPGKFIVKDKYTQAIGNSTSIM